MNENNPALELAQRLAESIASTEEDPPHSRTEFKALTDVLHALQGVEGALARTRILKSAALFFQVGLGESTIPVSRPLFLSSSEPYSRSGLNETEDKPPSAKEFLLQKQPRTDVERVACLAFYLTYFADTPHFKTLDVSKLNTAAAQPKFSNAAMAVDNATKSKYLVPAARGQKQISAMGELFVKALPNREAAKTAMTSNRQKRRRKNAKNADGSADSPE